MCTTRSKYVDRFRVVRDHHHGLPQIFVQLPQHLQHDFGILGIQVSGGLVREKNLRLVDDRPGDRHALLLAAGKLRRLVVEPAFEAQHFGHDVEAVRVESVTVNKLRDGDIAFGGQASATS